MKGFQQKSENTGKFFVVKHNSVCQESSKAREGYEPVEVVNPQTRETVIKFIKRYDTLEAMVTRIEWRDTENQYDQRYMSWKIHLKADSFRPGQPSETGVLELPFNSRVGSRFMKLAENIDFTKPVEFRAWRDTKTDSTAFLVAQDGKSVPQKYTRDNPGDCPEPVQKFGGKWNFDDQMEYLHGQMVNVVIPKVEAINANGGRPQYDDEGHFDPTPPSDDDPPF